MELKKPVLLVVLDGWGIGKKDKTDAIHLADTPSFDMLFRKYPHSQLNASSESVGLPKRTIGGSEVGHLHIGSGRLIPQDLLKINNDIKDKSFFKNKAIIDAIRYAQIHKSSLHFIGLLSDGGVHSHITHLFAILDLCKNMKFTQVYIHPILDGRDVPQKSALKYLDRLQKKIDTKSDKVLLDTVIQGFIKSTKEQKIRELRREMWQINRKTNLDEADHFLVQDILTDIEMLEEAKE